MCAVSVHLLVVSSCTGWTIIASINMFFLNIRVKRSFGNYIYFEIKTYSLRFYRIISSYIILLYIFFFLFLWVNNNFSPSSTVVNPNILGVSDTLNLFHFRLYSDNLLYSETRIIFRFVATSVGTFEIVGKYESNSIENTSADSFGRLSTVVISEKLCKFPPKKKKKKDLYDVTSLRYVLLQVIWCHVQAPT